MKVRELLDTLHAHIERTKSRRRLRRERCICGGSRLAYSYQLAQPLPCPLCGTHESGLKK